jgi:hypothetical protein
LRQLTTYAIKVSAPERAIMEVLYLVPVKEALEEAGLLGNVDCRHRDVAS